MNPLSEDLLHRLHRAAEQQATYLPSAKIQAKISHKTLGMIIAPTAMGKTFVMNRAIQLDKDFARVSVLTTRDPRPDDQGMFRYYQKNEADIRKLVTKIEKGELVQYAVFPHSGQIYGSEPQDFSKPYNLLATLSNAVSQLEHVGLRAAIPVGLIAHPKVWLEWFDARYQDRQNDRPARLQEALESIEWLLAHDEVRWLINEPGRVDSVARELIELIKHPKATDNDRARRYAGRMHDQISQMLQ